MDNRPIAQLFAEIADLLEIKGENLFKIRAYRSAADTIHAWADPVARMDEKQLLENLAMLVDAINRAKPSGAKGTYLRTLTVATTMGPGIRVDIPGILAEAQA